MPRTHYKGAFGTGSKEPSCSQIIGGSNSEDQMLATQMASRLTMRSGRAVFVSCQLASSSSSMTSSSHSDHFAMGNVGEGMDSDGMISYRAAALAEKEVWKILQEQQKEE